MLNEVFARTARFVLAAAAAALPAIPALAAGPPDNLVQELVLPNGMRFLLVERHDSPTVACFIAVGVGAADEPRGRTGMAHFLEHLLFKATDRLGTADFAAEKHWLHDIEQTVDAMDTERTRLATTPSEVAGGESAPPIAKLTALESLEAELARQESEMRRHVIKNEIWGTYDRHGGTIQNAFTNEDMTVYFVVLPANKIEVWARIEAERMTRSVLREFYSERSVVQEERRRSRESTPSGLIGEAIDATTFTSHPYRNPVIGWMSDLEHLRRSDVLDFYHTYYQPSNMVGVLVGDFQPEAAQRLISRHFGRLKSHPVVRPRRPAEPPMTGMRERVVEFDAEPELRLGFPMPDMAHADFPALDVLATILGGGRTSRLRKELILEKQAVRVAGAWVEHHRDPWALQVTLQPLASKKVEEVEAMAWEEIERLKQEPATDDELQAVKTRMRADAVYRLESNQAIGRWLAQNQIFEGDWREGYRYLDRVDAVSTDDVMRVARAYLTSRNEVRVELRRPTAALRTAAAADAGRKTP